MLPSAYTYLARSFLRAIRLKGLEDVIEMKEWKHGVVGQNDGWTYHAKGLWIAFPPSPETDEHEAQKQDPSVTVIGSSNYTQRSYKMDLEANVVICTSDADLRRRLGEEVAWLGEYANKVDEEEFKKPERRVGLGVRLSMWIVRVLGGAL
jgi:CDP-diacylglycerol---glycerol-3-phosphate 3-phosphatidyltransferase